MNIVKYWHETIKNIDTAETYQHDVDKLNPINMNKPHCFIVSRNNTIRASLPFPSLGEDTARLIPL